MFNGILDNIREKADMNDLCMTTIFALEAQMKAVVETPTIMHLLIKKALLQRKKY